MDFNTACLIYLIAYLFSMYICFDYNEKCEEAEEETIPIYAIVIISFVWPVPFIVALFRKLFPQEDVEDEDTM